MIIALCISAVVLVVLTAVYTYYFRLAFARKKPKFGSFHLREATTLSIKEKSKRVLNGLKVKKRSISL